MSKLEEKQKAIELRKQGYSYSEILKQISVAKSTLSLWLQSVGLSKKQKQRLTKKKLESALRGAQSRRSHRLLITDEIKKKARGEIGDISKRELWLIGTSLYWAEGNKQKENNVSQTVRLSNSDPEMINIFIKWLRDICGISRKDIHFRVSLHETAKNRLKNVQKYWADAIKFPISDLQKIDWKRNKINTKRKNTGEKYFGLLNVYVKRSTNLNRKIMGWVDGICKNT